MDGAGNVFSDARLLEAILQGKSQPLKEGVDTLLGDIARWHGAEKPQDDVSILAVELTVASRVRDVSVESVELASS
jgi:hypothetical protein